MERLHCELIAWSDNGWIQQMLTGLAMLHRREFISLKQTLVSSDAEDWRELAIYTGHLQLVINGELRLHYDFADHADVFPQALQRCDFYFKRSYSPELVAESGVDRKKILPLGMNYPVFPDWVDGFALRRAVSLFPGAAKLRHLLRTCDVRNWFTYIPRLKHAEAPPSADRDPRIFFLTRAWNPDDSVAQNDTRSRDFKTLNEMRADCVRLLREKFGDRLVAGFTYTPYGEKHFPDVIIRDKSIASRRKYLAALRSCPICIATEGLHGSNPWKMGEYISLSKAVVSEPLHHTVPGDFGKDTHYLEFASPEECVTAVRRLTDDATLRHRLMANNFHYYHAFLRPDMLVMNSVLQALALSAESSATSTGS